MKSLAKIAILLQCLVLICVWCEGSHHTNPSKGSCGKDEGIRYALTDSSSACLDGSKPVFYYRKATSRKSKKWLLFFEGGGWCYTFDDCFERSQISRGSTKQDPNCSPSHFFQDHLSNNPRINPMMHDWNMVYIRYCDGSSYAGNTVVTQQVPILIHCYHCSFFFFITLIHREKLCISMVKSIEKRRSKPCYRWV